MPSVATVTATSHAIDRESETVYANSRALFVARAAGRSIEHVMATCQLSHSCNLLTSRIATLQKVVTQFDRDIAGEIGSLVELGLRAQTLAVLLLLDELCESMRYDTFRDQELFIGRLHTIEDVVSFLFDSLARINRLWLRHRAEPPTSDGAPTPKAIEPTRRLLYRSAIRRAQQAIVALGTDPDLAHFLRAGSSRTDAPQVSSVCDQLADVLNVTLTREPDVALFLAAAVLEPEHLHDLTDDGGAATRYPPRNL
jgi:hypothetical protein